MTVDDIFTRRLPPLKVVDLPEDPPDPDHPVLGGNLPEWLETIRPDQWEAVKAIVGEFAKGARVTMFDAPTGSGKTLIAELVRRILGDRALYTCHTLSLQDQFAKDYPYAALLKGRSNYPTLDYADRFADRFASISCADCTVREPGGGCMFCSVTSACPYNAAKRAAIPAPVACVNSAFFLAEANGPGAFAGRPFLILDEADTLEPTLMSYVEVSISPSQQKRLGLDPPPRKTVAETWGPWVGEEAIPRVRARLGCLPPNSTHVPTLRERVTLDRLLRRLRRLAVELPDGGWVYDGYQQGKIVFRPVRVSAFGPEHFWRHASRFLLASATLIDPVEIAQSTGLPRGTYATVRMGSTFDPRRRPVFVVPVTENVRKNKDDSWPKMAAAVARIIDQHPKERVLVHAVSYDFSAFLFSWLQRAGHGLRLVTYTSAREREAALARYRQLPSAVIIAPSLDRGIDLPGDLCRVQVVTKIPFPNLGDKQVNARLYTSGGQLWYSTQTVRSLVQMTGRGMRSAEDSCATYILDATFLTNIWRKSRRLLPRWWTSALVFSGPRVESILSAIKEPV